MSLTEALAGVDGDMWAKARDREIAQLEKYGVIEWVDQVPEGKKIVDTKWVLLEKEERPKENKKQYKARLTARGFTQRSGIDYDETYAPVCREETWRILICMSLRDNLVMRQFDVEAAFLNGPLEEEIYVKDKHATGTKAWRLRKALYGLKQAASNWNLVINDLLSGIGYHQCPDDPGLYQGSKGLICVHVDDLLCAFTSKEDMKEWETEIGKHVTLEDRGLPSRFLGMTITWGATTAQVMGADTIRKAAETYGITKEARSPYLAGEKLLNEDADKNKYQAMIGSILYIARMWRPDIRYAVARLCIKSASPKSVNVQKAKKVLGYLLATQHKGIQLGPLDEEIEVYCDAGEETLEDHATNGIVVKSGASPLSWTSRKQDVTILSSTEAEYVALSAAAQDALWFTKMITFLEYPQMITIRTDNEGAATLTKNPDFHKRTKHIRRQHHFIRECVTNGELLVKWIAGTDNPADMLTKPVTGTKFTTLKKMIGMTMGKA